LSIAQVVAGADGVDEREADDTGAGGGDKEIGDGLEADAADALAAKAGDAEG